MQPKVNGRRVPLGRVQAQLSLFLEKYGPVTHSIVQDFTTVDDTNLDNLRGKPVRSSEERLDEEPAATRTKDSGRYVYRCSDAGKDLNDVLREHYDVSYEDILDA